MFVLTFLGDIIVAAVAFGLGMAFKDKVKAAIAALVAKVKAKL